MVDGMVGCGQIQERETRAKSIAQELRKRWDSLDTPQLHSTQILLALFLSLSCGQHKSHCLSRAQLSRTFQSVCCYILSFIFLSCATDCLGHILHLAVRSVVFSSCFKYTGPVFLETEFLKARDHASCLSLPLVLRNVLETRWSVN